MSLKRLFLPTLSLFAALTLSACSDDAPEVQKYTTLDTPVSVENLPELVEFFSLACDHCRSMESVIPVIEDQTGDKVSKVHVTFNESSTFSALIYYAAVAQTNGNPPQALVEALFKYVQEQQSESQEENKALLTGIFNQYGLTSPYDLDEAQQTELFTAIERADMITQESGITSVPTFMVDGKYIVNTAAHNNVEELVATIKALLGKNQ